MRFSILKSREFADSILSVDYFLEYATDWIGAHLSPEEVFDRGTLEDWALNNGYKLEENDN